MKNLNDARVADQPEARKELCNLIRDALERMSIGRLHSGIIMEAADYKAIAQTALERLTALKELQNAKDK